MKKQFKVPFDKNGNQLSYNWYQSTEVDNYEFNETLFYDSFERGRSALNIVWKNGEGKQFRSGMLMLDEILNGSAPITDSSLNDSLSISGKFTFKKQGTAILLTFAK